MATTDNNTEYDYQNSLAYQAYTYDWDSAAKDFGNLILNGLKYLAAEIELYYIGTNSNDSMTIAGVGGNVLAKDGNDSINVVAAYADIYAGNGNDTVTCLTAVMTIYDNGGNLTVYGAAGYADIHKYQSGNVVYNGVSAYNEIVMRAGTYIEPTPNAYQQFLSKIYMAVAEPLTDLANSVVNFFDGMGQVFEQAFTPLIHTFSSWNNFVSGVKSAFNGFVSAWNDVVKGIYSTSKWIEYSAYDSANNLYSWTKNDPVSTAAGANPYVYKWADDTTLSNYKFYFNDYAIALRYQFALDKMLFGGGYNANGDWVTKSQWTISGVDYAGVMFDDVNYRVQKKETILGVSTTTTDSSGTRTAAVLFTDRLAYYRYKYFETNGINNGLTENKTAEYDSLTAWVPPDMNVLIATLAQGYMDWLANGDGVGVSQVYLRSLYAVVNNLSYHDASNAAAVQALTQNYTYNLQGGAETAIESFGTTFLKSELRTAMADIFIKQDAATYLRYWTAIDSGTLSTKLTVLMNAGMDAGIGHRMTKLNGSGTLDVNYAERLKAYLLSTEGVAARQVAHEAAYRGDLLHFTQRTGMDLVGALKLMGVSLIDGHAAVVTDAVTRLLRAYAINQVWSSTQAWVNAAKTVDLSGAVWTGDELAELETESGLYSVGVRLGGESWNGNPNYEIYADGVLVASGTVTWAVASSTKNAADWVSTDSAWQTIWFSVESVPSQINVRLVNDAWGGNDAADRNLFVDKVYLSTDQTKSVDFTSKDIAANGDGVTVILPLDAGTRGGSTTNAGSSLSVLSDSARAALVGSVVQESMVDSTALALDMVTVAKLIHGDTRTMDTRMGVRLGGESNLGNNPGYEIYADGKLVASGIVTWAVATSTKSAADWMGTESAWQTVWFDVASRPSQVEVRMVNSTALVGSNYEARTLFVDKLYLSTDTSNYVSFTSKDVTASGSTYASKQTIASGLSSLLAAYEANAAVNLVTNGSFEQSGAPNTGWQRIFFGASGSTDRTAATLSGIAAADGAVYYELATDKNLSAYQNLATQSGRWYTLTFRYRPQTADAASNGMQVWWNGALLDTLIEDDGAWRTYSYRVQASSATTQLAFTSVGTSDGIGALLDDVRVGHGTDIIDYTINQALTANAMIGGVIRDHWEKQVGNGLVDHSAVLAALKAINGNIDVMDAVLDTYANGYVESLIMQATSGISDNGQTLRSLIAAYGSVAGDGDVSNNDTKASVSPALTDVASQAEIDSIVQSATDTSDAASYPVASTHGNLLFNGAAGYNKLRNEFDYGDIRFKGAGGFNKLLRKGISGNISFYGVGGGNVIYNRVTGAGNVFVLAGGLYNDIRRTDGTSGNLKAILGGAYNRIALDVGSGDLTVRVLGAANVITRSGAGNSDVVALGGSNQYSDDGKSALSIYSFGGSNIVTRGGSTDTGSTYAVLGGGANVMTINNNGTVDAQMYGGVNFFTYTGKKHVDLLMAAGASNIVRIGDGGSKIIAIGAYNNIHTGSGRDEVYAFGLANIINAGGSSGQAKDSVMAWGAYSDIRFGSDAGDSNTVDHSSAGAFVSRAAGSVLNFNTVTRMSSSDRTTMQSYGLTDSDMAVGGLSDTGVTTTESEATARDSTRPLTDQESDTLDDNDNGTAQRIETIRTANSSASADHHSAYVTQNPDGSYTATNDQSAAANNFDLSSHTTADHNNAIKAKNSTDLKQASKDDPSYGEQTEGAAKNTGPIVLDMNGNGKLDLLPLGSGVEFDITGDGRKENVAWVGKGGQAFADGILFYDKDNNLNTVTASEMVFADSASETDMQALARKYDANHDNVLSDTELNGFYVWQDNDSDGTVDAGEVSSVQTHNIKMINVDTSHTGGATTSHGNQVHRTNSFLMGQETRTVGDVSFNYAEIDEQLGTWSSFQDRYNNYDNVFLSGGLANLVNLGAADDAIIAISAYNQIDTGSGNDLALVGGLVNNLKTGLGDDIAVVGGFGNYVNLGAGNDTAVVTGFGNWIDTGSGNDVVVAFGLVATAPLFLGSNIVYKEGDGNLLAILASTANVIYNTGNGNVSGLMLGMANILHKEGTGDVSMAMGGAVNTISQKGSSANDRFLAIMFGAINVSTHIGSGDYSAYMFGVANVSTNVSEDGAAKEVVVMSGAGNIHTTVGTTDQSMYFLFGCFNVLTKIAGADQGRGDTWTIMSGNYNVATLITQGSVTGAFSGMYNVVTRIGGTGADDGFAAVFLGQLNIVTNIADGDDAVFMAGTANVFTKNGSGDSVVVMAGQGSIFTKHGDGDNLLVMGGLYGNAFTNVGHGNTLAILLAFSPTMSANVFNKWGNGDTAVVLGTKPATGGAITSFNTFMQIGNGRTYALAVGALNLMIKVGNGTYADGWGSAIDTSGLTNTVAAHRNLIRREVADGVDDGIDALEPVLANRYFNVVMAGYGSNNVMAEINTASLLGGYRAANGNALNSLTFAAGTTSTLQLAIANKGFGNAMVKAGDGMYVSIGISINNGGDAAVAKALAEQAGDMFKMGSYSVSQLMDSLKTASDIMELTSVADRAGANGLTGNIAINAGDGDAYFMQYGQNNLAVKVGDGGDKLLQYGTGNVHVRVGDAHGTPIAATINSYRFGEGAMLMMGRYNANIQYGTSNDLIIAVPRLGEITSVNPRGWWKGFDLELTMGKTGWEKVLDAAGLVFAGGSYTYYSKMAQSIKNIPMTASAVMSRKATQFPTSMGDFYQAQSARWTDLKNMWGDAFKSVKKSANFIHAGQGADIILAMGNANIVFGDNWASLIDISVASMLTYEWQFVSPQSFFALSSANWAVRLTTALEAVANGMPGGAEIGLTIPDASIAALFGLTYTAAGTVSENFDVASMGNYLMDLFSIEPAFSLGMLNSAITAGITTMVDAEAGVQNVTNLDNVARNKFGIGSFQDAFEQNSLDAYSTYATYNFNRIFTGPVVVSSFPNIGFLAYLFSDIGDIGAMFWAEATDDLVDYFTERLRLLTGDGDIIITKGEANLVFGGHGDDLMLSLGALNRVWGGYGDDISVNIGNYSSFQGNSGNDFAFAFGMNNLLFGDDGDDILVAVGGKNHISGGTGNDVIIAFGQSNRLKGGGGNDVFIAFGDSNLFVAGDGNDLIVVAGYSNTFYTGGGNDTIIAIGNTRTAAWISASDMAGKEKLGGKILKENNPGDNYYRTMVGAYSEYHGGSGVDTVVMLGRGDIIDGAGGADIFVLGYGARVDKLTTDSSDTIVLGDVAGFSSRLVTVDNISNWFTFTKQADDLKIEIADRLGLGAASVEIDNVYSGILPATYRAKVVLSYWASDAGALKAAWVTANRTGANFTYTYDYMYVQGEDLYDFIQAGRTDWENIVHVGEARQGTGFTLTHTTKQNIGLSLMGDSTSETITGTSGDDILLGGEGSDTISGLAGDDWLFGNGGHDTFIAGLGNDTIDGGYGTDIVDYSGMSSTSYHFTITTSDTARAVSMYEVAADGTLGALVKTDILKDIEDLRFSDERQRTYLNYQAPVFSSGTEFSIYEETLSVGDLRATSVHQLTVYYSIETSPDAALFSIDPDDGTLSFIAAPDYELPTSFGGGNDYRLTVKAVDALGGAVTQNIVVHVMNDEDAPIAIPDLTANITQGTTAGETLTGTTADDVIRPGGGVDTIDGGDGADTVSYANATEGYYIYLRDPTFSVNGVVYSYGIAQTMASATGRSGGTSAKTHLKNIENIVGTPYADKLVGDNRNNFFLPGAGDDFVYGLGGIDTVSYADKATGYNIVLENDAAGVEKGYSLPIGARSSEDALYSIENVIGTNYDDRITGNFDANVLVGGLGNDSLQGVGGGDTYYFIKPDQGSFGVDTISQTGSEGDGDTISITGNTLDRDDLWFSRSGNDLKIEFVGSDGTIVVKDWYAGTGQRIDKIAVNHTETLDIAGVEQLVTAMASALAGYVSGAGDVTGADYQGVNPNTDSFLLASLGSSLWQ